MHTERLTKTTSLGATPYHFFVPTEPAAAVPCCTSVHPSGSPRIELSTCCRSVAGLSCARYATPERCECDAECSQNYRHGQGQGLLHSIKPGQCRRWSKGSEQDCTPTPALACKPLWHVRLRLPLQGFVQVSPLQRPFRLSSVVQCLWLRDGNGCERSDHTAAGVQRRHVRSSVQLHWRPTAGCTAVEHRRRGSRILERCLSERCNGCSDT